jgi:NADH-quinone oxidoreductase subunit J
MGASPLLSPFLNDILFALCAMLLVSASLAVVLVRNPVRATLLLIISFLPASMVYLLMHAAFVGILQVLVYAGAIMMLFIFVIMMINPKPKGGETVEDSTGVKVKPNFARIRSALIMGGILLAIGIVVIPFVWKAASAVGGEEPLRGDFGTLTSISDMIFRNPGENPLTVSFELISFLILVGVVAALNFSKRKTAGKS